MGTILNRLKLIYAIYQIVALCYSAGTCSAQNVSAFFVFGDSLVDVGNSQFIDTSVKSAYPDGVDFVKGTEEELGFKDYSPPFLDPNTIGDVILKGVNYACAGSGILNSTGYINGDHISLSNQVGNFAKTREEIISRLGEAEAKKFLRQALYIVSIGSDDIILRLISPSNGFYYLDKLISELRSQLTMLYNLDARKIAVFNVAPLGCIPFNRDVYFLSNGCVGFLNKQVQEYNTELKSLLQELTPNLTGSTFVYVDANAIFEDISQNYKSYGFENADSSCCVGGTLGSHGGLFACGPSSHFCEDRTKYVFWDRFHPSEAFNLITAKKMLDGGLDYVSPMNLRQLANSH
ncbi:Lipase, GDSL [Corchorus olitorius]|uniref:Lipase, GDSL n=1 Tax=Corchorus olitorius TaxID=93759 RepID=A0A1R3H656_9ROSI|nr:Lipase, GDSL [Corchorus olitorius]